MIGIIAGLLLVVGIIVFMMLSGSGSKADKGGEPLKEDQRVLATVDSTGKAIEIQALMAREGLRMDLVAGEGSKVEVKFADDATLEERDRALITLVQSGLMDKNIGLESFDKGDLTASREEKRIKLVRAQQGELARLIRKIKPIEDASVALSIPEPTIFKSEQKPMSASVQVTIPNGERLEREKVRSIINLMVGSIQGLDAEHVALSDTNGNTYNSVLDIGAELQDKLEEQDQYMKQKVAAQLDKLVGAGHYVVTVSTLLREAPRETMVQTFDPDRSAVTSEQTFTERLNANSGRQGLAGGPASSFVPKGMDVSAAGGSSGSRGYVRDGAEVTYANGKTQWVETSVPGMIEDISIAVTIDKNFMPSMGNEQLQQLLAHAASPKVNPTNVTIAQTDFERPSLIPTSTEVKEIEKDLTWIAWPIGAVIIAILVLVFLSMMRGSRGPSAAELAQLQQNQLEIQQLREFTTQQMSALQASQQQAQMILEQQRQQLLAQQAEARQATAQIAPGAMPEAAQAQDLRQTLTELKEVVQEEAFEPDELDLQIKSWIEST
jgi:flagellar M-ring protein FliF